jgi:16S rRNA (cytosine1407-C5)-methyltransferase
MKNESFEAYYEKLYGDRWEGLRKSLLEDHPAFAFSHGLTSPYFLDHASVLAANSLRLPPAGEHTILDACAAPGGKTLVIASAMPAGAQILANELSSERRRRLVEVLDSHLDKEKRERVRVSGFDAAAQGSRKSEHSRFAAILLDVPCSSEAHVLKDDKALAVWTPARPRNLARRQWALLSSAFLLLKAGGSLVYSSCALGSEENDQVISRLLDKYGKELSLDPPDFSEGEKTEFGKIILPDYSKGMGPMYVARIQKNPG